MLWRARTAFALASALLQLTPLLRLSSLWGANSLIFSASVTAWTGAGWMCRIYLTVGLGLLQPLCACFVLVMLAAGLRW